MLFFADVNAQEVETAAPVPHARSRREGNVRVKVDSLSTDTLHLDDATLDAQIDSVKNEEDYAKATGADTSRVQFSFSTDPADIQLSRKSDRFIPNPKKALWLSIVIPGGGQIYNRKYWKLPLVYGGFLGCAYAMTWNNTMYRDYSQAYIDIMDTDDNTKSYENFIPPSYNVSANLTRLQELFKRKKNYYRRYRDLSMFCMIGVYALSILDAYVDAELSSFDISRDLSMKVHPTVINDRYSAMHSSGMNSNSYGLQCSLAF